MPKVSFYLRNEDLDAWKSIEKKTAWVHTRLNPDEERYKGLEQYPDGSHGITIAKAPPVKKFNKMEWCKQHDMEKEYCKGFKHKG